MDAAEISNLTISTLRNINAKDYSREQIEVWEKTDSVEKVTDRLRETDRHTLVALQDNMIVGVGSLKENEITALYISASFIGKGIGKEILKALEIIARAKSVKIIGLHSSTTACGFYTKYGYKRVKDSFHVIDGKNIPCIVMEKSLTI